MTRFVAVIVLMVLVLGGDRVAHAQATGMLPNGSQIQFTELEIQARGDGTKNDDYDRTDPTSDERRFFFNRAHCNCAKVQAGSAQSFRYRVTATQRIGNDSDVDFWVGTQCSALENRGANGTCVKLGAPTTSVTDFDDELGEGGAVIRFNLYDVVNGKRATPRTNDCVNVEGNLPIYALAKGTANDDSYDYSITQQVGLQATETGRGLDTQPPPQVTGPKADASDSSIVVSWDAPSSSGSDVAYYQALCAKDDGSPVKNGTFTPRYVSTRSVCVEAGPEPAESPQLIDNAPAGEMPEDPNGEDPGGEDPDGEEDPDEDPAEGDADRIEFPTGDFGNFDKAFICGETQAPATSLRIRGLENDTRYSIILLTIDAYGNFKSSFFQWKVSPIPSTDFWEDLHERGSDVEGGLCLLAETYGDDSGLTQTLRSFRDDTLASSPLGRWLTDAYYATLGKLGARVHGSTAWQIAAAIALAPLVAIALLWHWLSLPGLLAAIAVVWLWRRRRAQLARWAAMLRSHRIASLGAIAFVVLGAGHARADGYQPYWESPEYADPDEALDEATTPRWNVGVRIGPYTPEIDNQFGRSPGPYEQMFPGTQLLTALDVDYLFWSGLGQAGIGISLGYSQKTARVFAVESEPTDPRRVRTADRNTFRLVPAALTATYRFTWLDDQYGIPVVPYARAGLSYYVWWLSTSANGISEACKPGEMGVDCDTTRALGASLGYQASIGVSIRAERIDHSTAVSMRSSGIMHAGIYGELSLAKVDGFGSDSKLSVGDKTFFGGVNFEF